MTNYTIVCEGDKYTIEASNPTEAAEEFTRTSDTYHPVEWGASHLNDDEPLHLTVDGAEYRVWMSATHIPHHHLKQPAPGVTYEAHHYRAHRKDQ